MRRFTASLESLQAHFKKLSDESVPLKSLFEKFDGEFWKLFVDRVNVRLRNCVSIRERDYSKMSELDLKLILKEEAVIKEIITFPLECQKLLNVLNERKNVIREKIKKIKGDRYVD